MTHRKRGFTMIEMMAVMVVIAILAAIALPSYQGRMIRVQVVEGLDLAEIAMNPIEAAYPLMGSFPDDNKAIGLPDADKIVNKVVSSVAVEKGSIHVTFGNEVNPKIRGKVLTLRPAVVLGEPKVPVVWICGNAKPPGKMTVIGVDRTTLSAEHLPRRCPLKNKTAH